MQQRVQRGRRTRGKQGYAYCWGLNARSEKLDAAWEFLQFLISSEGFSGDLYTQNTLPINTVAQATWANNHAQDWGHYGAEEEIKNYFHQLQDVVDTLYNRYDQPYGWYDAVYVPFEKYLDDEISLDEAMEEADANWERFLAE